MKAIAITLAALLGALPLAAQTPTPTVQPAQSAAPTPATAPASTMTPWQIQHLQELETDWAQLGYYRADDASIPPPAPGEQRVVFYGDSITWGWSHEPAPFFPGKPYVNRGISGQTTPQMLVRFQQDVVHLKPAAVVILAGTNDVAGNTGPETPQMIEDNFASMAAIAKYYQIKVIFASILPAAAYPWKPGMHPAEEIRSLNAWLKDFCSRDGDIYLDYYNSLANAEGGMKPGLSKDGVHPTAAGYAIMAPMAENAIGEALKQGTQANAGGGR